MLYRGKDKKEFYLASLLYDSIEFRHIESVKSLLVERGADPNVVLPKKGISAFHLVIGCDSNDFALKVTSLILQNGGNPNVRSDDGLTPVHIAAAWGRMEILTLLLSNGGDPEVRDLSRKTPFHYAVEEGFTECLNLLRSYLPVKNDLLKKEDVSDVGCLVLDKILVNNGAEIGEYNVAEDQPTNSIIPNENHLHSLPQTDTTEYILNWFTKQHESVYSSNIVESIAKNLGSSSTFECSDGSPVESDGDNDSKRYDSKYITFRKMYRKTRSKSISPKSAPNAQNATVYLDARNNTKQLFDDSIYTDAEAFTELKEYSKESGVVSMAGSLTNSIFVGEASKSNTAKKSISKQEKSSDYLTCSHTTSITSLEKNIFELTDDLSSLNLNIKSDNVVTEPVHKANSVKSDVAGSESNDCSFVSVSEVYKYVDRDQGVVLYERRLLKTSSEYAKSVKSSNISSNLSSLPPTFDYDTDTLKKELTFLGYNPGPITVTTKRVYLRKLHQLKKYPSAVKSNASETNQRVYSLELEKTLRNSEWCSNIVAFRALEEVLVQQFSSPDPSRKWREGINKSSFTYLLLDPRLTNNLPYRVDSLQPLQAWESFLSAIFYVGKGKRSRPYQHLYDAVDLWKKDQFTSSSTKLQKIIDIWKSGGGVICLHIFLNIIPVEAYTREAAMISAIKLENLTNVKSGEFYGVPATWPQKQKRMLGVYLLHKAMMIFLNEGERQLCPQDID